MPKFYIIFIVNINVLEINVKMKPNSNNRQFKEITKSPDIKFLIEHGKLGLIVFFTGIFSIVIIMLLHNKFGDWGGDYLWSAIMSIPVTIMCMGVFSVLYEWSIRNTFKNAMRSVYWAWDTGVTVFPSHKSAPNRTDILEQSKRQVKLMSTTLNRYFLLVNELVESKISNENVKFYFILYDPDSSAVREKALEEGASINDFQEEIKSTCRRYLGPLKQKYPENVNIKFCGFNTPFGITIIDDLKMVLSLNIYGLSRSKNQTPCLIIENKYDPESVFKLYDDSFDAIWEKLEYTIPNSLKHYFPDDGISKVYHDMENKLDSKIEKENVE